MYTSLAEYLAAGEPADVCVIGSGAAGLSISLQLAQRGYRVLLCEGGEQDYTERSQALYRGETVGDPYIPLDVARLRFFGGSTNHWGGMCRPLDDYDFSAKPAAPETAWPLAREELAPYYAPARKVLNIDGIAADQPLAGATLKQVHFWLGAPVQFKHEYADEVRRSTTLNYCKNANLFGLETRNGRVSEVFFKDYSGQAYRVKARFFVLACGGIENSRLLLWCNRQARGQLVKQPATLGRYWMDHPHATLGAAVIFDPARLGLDREISAFIAPTREAIVARGILNCGLRLHRMGAPESRQLIDALSQAAPALGRRLQDEPGLRDAACGAVLRAAWEQQPQADNRIELDDGARDTLGMPRARLIWRKSTLDYRTVRESALMLGDYLRDSDIGRIKLDPWLVDGAPRFPPEGELAGSHHMGGTRMARHAEAGVVDPDCRVFGQDNLYVAGSSVFPSSGHANPTLTLVQLALRLTDHLQQRLS